MSALCRRARGDDGTSLVELLVAMVLMAMVGTLVVSSVSTGFKTVTRDDDETQGLADVQVSIERLTRDLRIARSVNSSTDATAPSNTSQLTLWIDKNSDYRQVPLETITWKLQPSGDGSHFNLVRKPAGGDAVVEGRALIDGIAFFYDTGTAIASDASTTGTKVVTCKLKYDALSNRGSAPRKIDFSVRMRNVG